MSKLNENRKPKILVGSVPIECTTLIFKLFLDLDPDVKKTSDIIVTII